MEGVVCGDWWGGDDGRRGWVGVWDVGLGFLDDDDDDWGTSELELSSFYCSGWRIFFSCFFFLLASSS